MFVKKLFTADRLFWYQIIGATLFCGAYFVRSLHDVAGSSLVQFILFGLFLLLHLSLSIGAHNAEPSRTTKQAIFTYAYWLVGIIAICVAVVTNQEYVWTSKEMDQVRTAIILFAAVIFLMVHLHLTIKDPMIKAFFAIVFKSVPQVLLAWKFLAEGGSGTPLAAIIMGHVTILIRLGQTYFLVKEAGWDRNRIWLVVSETANELSWVVATIAWVFVL